jgi:hypothetical protein
MHDRISVNNLCFPGAPRPPISNGGVRWVRGASATPDGEMTPKAGTVVDQLGRSGFGGDHRPSELNRWDDDAPFERFGELSVPWQRGGAAPRSPP